MKKVRIALSTVVTIALVAGGTIMASDKPKEKPKNNSSEPTIVEVVEPIVEDGAQEQTVDKVDNTPKAQAPEPVVDNTCVEDKEKALKDKKTKLSEIDANIAGARDWLMARYGAEYYQTHDIEADIAAYVQTRFAGYRNQVQSEHDALAAQFDC